MDCQLSVIIPVYNTSIYLTKCIDSVVEQNVPNMEILLIDDGSTDDSPLICKEYANKYPQIKYYRKENGGLSSARNYGLDKAVGNLITFVDSDDFLELDIYKRTLSVFGDSEAIAFGSNTTDEIGNISSTDFYGSSELNITSILTDLVFNLKTAVWNKIFRRDFIKNNRFPEGRIHGEDLVFILSCLTSDTHFQTVPYIGYNYVKHPGSITTSGLKRSSFDEIWCKDKAAEILASKFGMYEKQTQNWRFRARLNVCRKLIMSDTATNKIAFKKTLTELGEISHGTNTIVLKNKIEFILLKYASTVYKFILQHK